MQNKWILRYKNSFFYKFKVFLVQGFSFLVQGFFGENCWFKGFGVQGFRKAKKYTGYELLLPRSLNPYLSFVKTPSPSGLPAAFTSPVCPHFSVDTFRSKRLVYISCPGLSSQLNQVHPKSRVLPGTPYRFF